MATRRIQTRAIATLQARIDDLMYRAEECSDQDAYEALNAASAALEVLISSRMGV